MTREPESQERCSDGEPHCWHDDGRGMEECCGECGLRRGAGSALHNARLAPQDAGNIVPSEQAGGWTPWRESRSGHIYRERESDGAIEEMTSTKANSLTTRLREAEQAFNTLADLVEATREPLKARVTALEAALASQNYIQWADDRVPGSQETR